MTTTETQIPRTTETALPHTAIQPPPSRKPRGPSIAKIMTGAVIGLAGAALSLGGGAVLLVDNEKGADGYFMSDGYSYAAASGTAALKTDSVDIDLDGAEWLVDSKDLGNIKLDVESESGKPVFAGVAKTEDVDRYLSGVATTTVTDVEFGPFEPSYATTDGKTKTDETPAEQTFWKARSDATGKLTWEVEDGDWTVVVMNADGSPNVEANVRAGANVPVLDDIGWTLLAAGLLGFAGGAALLITGAMRR